MNNNTEVISNRDQMNMMANNAEITYFDEFDAHVVYNETIRRLETVVAMRLDTSLK